MLLVLVDCIDCSQPSLKSSFHFEICTPSSLPVTISLFAKACHSSSSVHEPTLSPISLGFYEMDKAVTKGEMKVVSPPTPMQKTGGANDTTPSPSPTKRAIEDIKGRLRNLSPVKKLKTWGFCRRISTEFKKHGTPGKNVPMIILS